VSEALTEKSGCIFVGKVSAQLWQVSKKFLTEQLAKHFLNFKVACYIYLST